MQALDRGFNLRVVTVSKHASDQGGIDSKRTETRLLCPIINCLGLARVPGFWNRALLQIYLFPGWWICMYVS